MLWVREGKGIGEGLFIAVVWVVFKVIALVEDLCLIYCYYWFNFLEVI